MKLKLALQLKTASAIWQKAVKSFSRFSEKLIRATPLIVGGQSRGWVKTVFLFSRMVLRIRRYQGSRGLALFLKGQTLLLQRLVSGCRLSNPREAGPVTSVTNSGVPRWIPIIHRRAILGGDRDVIRFYLGLLTLYRVIDFKGKLSLSTITDQGKELDPKLTDSLSDFTKEFVLWSKVFGIKPCKPDPEREDPAFWGQTQGGLATPLLLTELSSQFKWMFTSGPNSRVTKVLAVGNAWTDMLAIISRPYLFKLIEIARGLTGSSSLTWLPWFEDAERALKNWVTVCQEYDRKQGRTFRSAEEIRSNQFDVGALSVVEEPGKKRIVAMVDIWTQWLYYPLHLFLFKKVLGLIPEDGTFDQLRPVKALLEKAKKEGREHFWSYDLSAATDRLPIAVQIPVLGAFTSMAYAEAWAEILTSREYRTPKEYATTFGVSHVKYSVGQPMGAYSSWAMLALTHHFLVQYCAWKTGHRKWFQWYAVLGDDIVICDREVALQYVRLMDDLGVGIGFHKSIISTNSSLEFAKRFFLKGEEVSPLSLAGIAVGWLGPGYVPEVLASCESKTGKEVTLYQLARYIGVGYKAASAAGSKLLSKLPRILTSTLLLLLRPGAPRGFASLREWYSALNMSGSTLKLKVATEEQIFDCVWKEVTDRDLANALKRAKVVLKGLFIPDNGKKGLKRQEHPLGEEFTASYREWFADIIVQSFLRRFYGAIDHAGRVLRDAMKSWTKTRDLTKSLALVEECFSILSLIPNRVNLVRREVEEGYSPSEADVFRVLVPGSVKRWARLAQFTDRKVPHMLKPRRKVAVSPRFKEASLKRLSRA